MDWSSILDSIQNAIRGHSENFASTIESVSEDELTEHSLMLKKHGLLNQFFIDQSPLPWPASLSVSSSYISRMNCEKHGIDFWSMYKLNSFGLRCDEFTKEHDGKHVVFGGCSISFGDGLPDEYSWTRIVYDTLGSKEKLSGYFNLSFPGASNIFIFLQALKYIQIWGCPDLLILNLPDSEREFYHSEEDSRIHIVAVHLYRTLKYIIELNGAKLVMFSWDAIVNEDYHGEKKLGTYDPRFWFDKDFYRFSVEKRTKAIYDFQVSAKNDLEKQLAIFSFDELHPGIPEHRFYANFVLDILNGRVAESYKPSSLKHENDDRVARLLG
jgi:hypothetical protein